MIRIQIDENDFIKLLLNRCLYWSISSSNIDLFEKMYQNYIDNNIFENNTMSIMEIVDNDAVNYCRIIYFENKDTRKDFIKLLRLYRKGEYDVSCEDFETINPSFIEAVSDDEKRILWRY